MKSIIAGIIDNVLTFLTATFFSIAVAGYFSNDFKVILVSALTCAVCITALTDMFRENRKPLENPRIKEVLTQFIYNDEKFASDYICAALEKKYTVENKGKFILVNGVTAVFVRLKPGRISAKDIAYIYGDARAHAKKTVILSVDGADTDCLAVAEVLPAPKIIVFDGKKTFELLEFLDALPETEITLKRNRPTASQFFRACISPQRARRYFFVSLVLLLSSFFMPQSIYYIITASVCMILGIISKINLVERLKKSG